MNADERRGLDELAEAVIGASFEVSNTLGVGFLEKVYRNALQHELRIRGVNSEAEQKLIVRYKGVVVGEYIPDLLVADRLIVELKCVRGFVDEHMAQCINYLKATEKALALLLNFQKPRIEIKRIVHNF